MAFARPAALPGRVSLRDGQGEQSLSALLRTARGVDLEHDEGRIRLAECDQVIVRGERLHPGEAHRGQVPRPEGLSLVGVEVERIGGMIEDSDPVSSAKHLGALAEMKEAIWKNPGGKSLANALVLQVEHNHLLLSRCDDEL